MAPMVPRSVQAVFVALAIAVVTGTGLGLVQAADGTTPMPAAIGLAQPTPGEAGSYNATATGAFAAGLETGAPFEAMTYVRFGGPTLLDRYARPVATDGLAWSGMDFTDAEEAVLYHAGEASEPAEAGWEETGSIDYSRAGTTEFVASGGSFGGSQQFSYQPSPLLPAQSGTIDYNMTIWTFEHQPSCLLASTLQGGLVSTSSDILWGSCDLLGLVELDEDVVFHASPGPRFAGFDTVRLESLDNGTSVAFLVNASMPVPLRAEVHTPDGSVVVDLLRFQAGTPSVPAPPLGTPPTIEKAPRQPWGLDDTGSRLKMPPSVAYSQALKDPVFTGLRDYLADHPGAYTFMTHCLAMENPNGDGTNRDCFFFLTDGPTAYGFVVAQSVHQPPAVAIPELLVTYQYAGTNVSTDAGLPTIDQVPAEVPTLRALEERYLQFSNGGPIDSMDMFLLGPAFEEGGLALLASVSHVDIGMRLAPLPADPAHPEIKYFDLHAATSDLTVDQDGAAWFYTEIGLADASSVAVLSPPSSAPPLPEHGSQDEPLIASLLTFWVGPAPQEAAGVGLLALLGGALYWLWPSIKGGSFLGLFSRLQGPKLLEHPARARLVEVVQAEPGIHFKDLVRRSGVPNGAAVHHLHKLTKDGLLSARPLGRYTCYFPGTTPDRATLAAAEVLRSDGARRIYEAIQASPGLSGLDLAAQLGLQPSTVSYHVQKLVDGGLVSALRDGRSVRLRAASAA